jgi:two-component system OmpR family response regulator/two-component system alkaline phosphatase synthesis response regulator PhoP
MKRILVAEDDRVNREVVVQYLQMEGYRPVEARDGVAALRLVRGGVDLAVLDIGLPAVDGLSIIRTIRAEDNALPIIVLSARVDEADRIVAFEAGADDYVPKPLMPRELVYRVRALLRRTEREVSAARVRRVGPVEVDEAARELRINGTSVDLRPREFALIATLAANPGIALPRRTLIDRAWGMDFSGEERTVDGHIRSIRRKLRRFPEAVAMIKTIYGFGYRFGV